jgi:hypothetical protein
MDAGNCIREAWTANVRAVQYSLESVFMAEADAVPNAEGNTEAPYYLVLRLCRGRRAGHAYKGFPRNLGGPNVSLKEYRSWGIRFNKIPGLRLRRSEAIGAKERALQGYRQATAMEQGGTGVRKSEPLILLRKPGNSPQETRWREGAVKLRCRWRERW